MLCAKNSPKTCLWLACLFATHRYTNGRTNWRWIKRTHGQKTRKKASSKRSRKSSSVRHKQANRRCCAIILLRWKDNMIIRYSNSRLIHLYIYIHNILIHNTKYTPSHCHINIPVQYSMYDTYSLYSNYEYNLMCYLYTSFSITALIESYWIRYMLRGIILENPYKCRERAHCMVCCLTASHTKQNNIE